MNGSTLFPDSIVPYRRVRSMCKSIFSSAKTHLLSKSIRDTLLEARTAFRSGASPNLVDPFHEGSRPRDCERTFSLVSREVGPRMTFPFTCSACGYVNQFGWSQIGQKIQCAGCEKTMTVPVPMEAVGPATTPPRATTFRCPSCRRKFSTKPELAGKKIRCNGCGAGVRVPGGEQESVGPTSQIGNEFDPRGDHADTQGRPAEAWRRRATRVQPPRKARPNRRRCSTSSVGSRQQSGRVDPNWFCHREPS